MSKTVRGESKERKAKLIKGYKHNAYANRHTRRTQAKRSGVFKQKETWGVINHDNRAENRQTIMRTQDKRGNVDYTKPPTNKNWHDKYK